MSRRSDKHSTFALFDEDKCISILTGFPRGKKIACLCLHIIDTLVKAPAITTPCEYANAWFPSDPMNALTIILSWRVMVNVDSKKHILHPVTSYSRNERSISERDLVSLILLCSLSIHPFCTYIKLFSILYAYQFNSSSMWRQI